MVKNQKGFSRWKGLAIGLGSALLIFVIVFFAVPLQTVSYTVTERYQAIETYYVTESYVEQESYIETETYYEKEPFTTYETYYEKEPYDQSVPIDYIVTSKGSYSYFWSTGFDVWVNIKNTDLKSGTFTVVFNLILKGGAATTKSASKYIAIGDTEEVQVSYTGAWLDSYTYSITPPTKTVTVWMDVQKKKEVVVWEDVEKTREVTKYRPITKYRDVPKERTVWKERPVIRYKKVSLFEYLTSY